MEFKQFSKAIYERVSEFYGESVKAQIEEVEKNNGVKLTGLILFKEQTNISPAVYLDDYYKEYRRGRKVGDIAAEIIRIYNRIDNRAKIDMNFLKNYETAGERICFKLVHFGRNEALLREVPHIPYLDLAIVFYFAYESDILGKGSVLIRNSYLKDWNISVQDLYRNAASNTKRLFPVKIMNIDELAADLTGEEKSDETDCSAQILQEKETLPMYVLTNRSKQFGAAGILYPEQLKKMADQLKNNLFVLPSSIHEVILLPDHGENPGSLKFMVREVNETQVAEEEILSDSVYYYDRETDKVRILCD